MFPKWLNIHLNWEKIIANKNIEGFFDNIPVEYKLKKVKAFNKFYKRLEEQIKGQYVTLDPSFDLSNIKELAIKNPEVAAKMAEFQAMLLIANKTWNYAHP